jgi:hypothetical protein
MAHEPNSETGGADRRRQCAAALVARFRALPAVDPQRLRADVDATVDQRLPEDDHP